MEVKSFSEFPDTLKATIRAGWVVAKDREEESPGGYRIFVAGGASVTSALFAYDAGDYVPMEEAIAYVYLDSKWIVAKKWDHDIGPAKTLSQLIFIIDYLSKRASAWQEGAKP